MPSPSPFDILDHKFLITRISRTAESVVQTAGLNRGKTTAATEASVAIKGKMSYQATPSGDEISSTRPVTQTQSSSLVLQGSPRFHTSEALNVGDILVVQNSADAADVTRYRVTELVSRHPTILKLIGTLRKTYSLALQEVL